MATCDICGDEITFRYINGRCAPLHDSGSCLSARSSCSKRESEKPTASLYTYESFVNPNARCPDCGQEVFFFQSHSGGKIFFDELGPPWPKHPCTDNPRSPSLSSIQAAPPDDGNAPSVVATRTYRWQSSGWEPFYVLEIKEVHNGKFLAIRGISKGAELSVYIQNELDFPRSSPMHLREKSGGCYRLSTILVRFSSIGNGPEKVYAAYRSLRECYLKSER